MKEYILFAYRNVIKRSLRSWLTTLGICIGVAAVVALISLGQGMQNAINQQFAGVGTDKVLIQGASAAFGPPGQLAAGSIDKDDLKLIERTSGVKRAAGRLLRSVTVEYADTTHVIFAASLPEESNARNLVIEANSIKAARGELLRLNDRKKVLLGYNFWATNTFPKQPNIGNRMLINNVPFQVVGLLDKIGAGRDDSIMINEEDARDLFNEPNQYSALIAQVQEGQNPATVADRITSAMRRNRNQKEGFEDFTVQTSESLISTIGTILAGVQAVFIGIAAISVLVGSLGIMNTMYTAVLERTKEIGIMKAVGAQRNDILLVFMIESGLLGLGGGIVGILVGMGLSKLVEIIGQGAVGSLLKASFPWYLIVGALFFSFLLGIMSGVFPAREASALPPIEALRGNI